MDPNSGRIYTPDEVDPMDEKHRERLVALTKDEAEMYGQMNRAARRRAARQLRKHGRGFTK